MTVSTIRLLRRLGDGNLSAGLRQLALLYERIPEHTRQQLLADDAQQEPHGEDDPGDMAPSDHWD